MKTSAHSAGSPAICCVMEPFSGTSIVFLLPETSVLWEKNIKMIKAYMRWMPNLAVHV